MTTKTSDLSTIYNYLVSNEKVLQITDIQLYHTIKKGKPTNRPYISFRCAVGLALFNIYHNKPLITGINPMFELVMTIVRQPKNWQGSYDDLICLAKSLLYFNNYVAMEYIEKRLRLILTNYVTYKTTEDFLKDIDNVITHNYTMALKLYTKMDKMEVDYKNSIVNKSMMQKYALSFLGDRMFAIANEIF